MVENERAIAWNTAKISSAVVGISWIAIQVTVLFVSLIGRGFDPQPRQFGWQMYTAIQQRDDFQVIFNDKPIKKINIDDYAHNVRPGLVYGDIFLDYLCQTFPDAKQTRRIYEPDAQTQTYQCSN